MKYLKEIICDFEAWILYAKIQSLVTSDIKNHVHDQTYQQVTRNIGNHIHNKMDIDNV